MKHWSGDNFNYRGYSVINNKKQGFLEVYDNRGNPILRVNSFGKGCVTDVKRKIDDIITRFG